MSEFIQQILSLSLERKTHEDIDLERELIRTEKGLKGEAFIKEVFSNFSEQLLILSDYNFRFNGAVGQIDLLVIAGRSWYVIEVKNYENDFTYQDRQGVFTDTGMVFNEDIMATFNRRLSLLRQLVDYENLGANVYGLMVYANSNASVNIDYDSIKMYDFKVLKSNQLEGWLRKNYQLSNVLASMESNPVVWEKEIMNIQPILSKYEFNNYRYFPKILDEFDFNNFLKGVVCPSCRMLGMEIRHRHFHCKSCGQLEGKTQAIVRTAKELRTMYYHNAEIVTSKRIIELVGNDFNRRLVINVLSDNFPKKGKARATYYDVTPLRGLNVSEQIDAYLKNYYPD